MDDRYGLRAIYSFQVAGDAMSNMASVRDQLRGIVDAVRNLSETSATSTPRMGRDFNQMGTRMSRGTEQASNSLRSFAASAKAARDRIQPLKAEFRALKAECRNIDFGDLTDSNQFRQASQDIQAYIASLQSLERQIQGNTFAEREFGASLKQQQRIAQTRIDMAGEQRKAAIASQRLGVSQGLQSTGQNILGTLEAPIQSAQELQQSLGNVKKLADDLSSEGYRDLTNSALNFSAAMGVADTEITAIYEDLAGAGKGFGKELQDRIGETEGILQVKSALDVSIGAATQLDITLGSIYKHSLTDYAGGVVELNQRTASSINELADNLQNVRISAEDVIPVMKVVMNVAGDAKNFPVSDIAAYGAAISALGTVEPEAAGSFFNRLGTSMAGKFKGAFIENLGYGNEATFGQAVDTDKLGVLLRILEKYKNLEGGELVKGSFLSGIGIKSAQDQKLVQGLANNLDVLIEARKVAAAGFQGQEGQDLSVQAEFNRTMQTGAFQSRRFQAAITALKDTLGLAIQDALTPFLVNLSDIIGVVLKFTQKYPGLTRAIALGTFGFGALATAVGTAGIVLFGFQQASATASVAMLSMRSSLLPLTGFFETGLAGMAGGTNALTASLNLLGKAGSMVLAPFTVLGSILSFLTSPIVLAIASLTSLYLLIQSLNPQVNLLGKAFSLIAAPVGYIKGLLSGFVSGILPVIAPLGKKIKSSLVGPLGVVSEALQQARDTFAEFSTKGEQLGNQLAQGLISAFTRIGVAWDYTISWLKSRIEPLVAFFRSVGQMFVSALAENSPGPTFQIRAKWDETIIYIKEKVSSLRAAITNIGEFIAESFGLAASFIKTSFANPIDYGIRAVIRGIVRTLYSEISLAGTESVPIIMAPVELIKGNLIGFADSLSNFGLGKLFANALDPVIDRLAFFADVSSSWVESTVTHSSIFRTSLTSLLPVFSAISRNIPILIRGVNGITTAFQVMSPTLRRIVPGLGLVLFLIDTIHILYRVLNFLDTKLGWSWLDGLVGGLKIASDAIDLVTSKIKEFVVSGVNTLISAISTNWNQGLASITENWQLWVDQIVAGIDTAKSAITSIPDNLSTTFNTLLTDSGAILSAFVNRVESWFKSLGSVLVHFVPDTIRGVFERLNLANFILLFTSSLPLGLLSGQIKGVFVAAVQRALPGIAAAIGFAAFGPLVEAIALALPVVASLLVSSGIADKVTEFFSTVFTDAVDYAVNDLGLQLPDWLKTVGAFTQALDQFFRQLGQLATSIPTPAFFTVLSPFILAVVSRFNQATKAFELFIEKAGGIRTVLALIGQGLKKIFAPLRNVANIIVDILTGPPPDLGFLIRPLVAAFNYIKPLLQPIISTVATVLRPLLSSLGTALQPLISSISLMASQIYAVLIPAFAAMRANLLGALTAVLESPAFVALLPFLNLLGGGAIAAGLGVARAASGGAAAVAGGVKSAIDIAAPRLVQAGDFSVRLLGNILKTVLLIARELTGAAIAPLNILQELLDFGNIERVTQAAGRVTPIDLLPFFEDVRLGKIQKQSGVLVNSLGPLGRTLVQLRFSFVAILEVVGFLGLGIVGLEGYLKATGSGFSIFGTAAILAAQTLNVARVAIYALRLAWISLRYITLDLSNKLIPPRLAEVTPQWVKNTSTVLKVLRDVFLLTAKVVSGALYAMAVAVKAVYSAIVLLGVVPALQVLKYGLILVKSVLEIVTGDFHSLARVAEIAQGAFLRVTTAIYNLRDVLIPVALIFGTLLFPRIGLVTTVVIELIRGFKDVRNIFNLTYQSIKFVVGGLYELRGAITMVSLALLAVFNLSSPWLIALTAGIGWVIEWTRGFKELHQIIDALSGAIAFLDKSIKGLIDSVFAPISFGPFQGMIEFIKNNWPVILGAFVAFNVFLTRNLFRGFQKSFGILPRMIGLISTSFQKMVGVFTQIFPFFNRFRREVTTLRGEALATQAGFFQGEYIGGRPKATIGDRDRLGRQEEILKFRSLLEQEALSEARRRHTEKRLQRTYSHRTPEGYERRLENPRSGPLDPRRILDTVEARTVQFNTSQIESARTNVIKDYQRMNAIAQKAGLGGFSLPQLQAMSSREGSDYYTQKGIMPSLDAKYIEIRAGEVSINANRKQGQRQGIGSIDQEQQIQGAYARFLKESKGLSKELAKLDENQIGVPGAVRKGLGSRVIDDETDMKTGYSGESAISADMGILGDVHSMRIAKGMRPLTTQQEQRISEVLTGISKQSGSVGLEKLKEVAEHMGIAGARGRQVPPELVEFEQAIFEAKIRRQASPSTFGSYEPRGFVELTRLMQSDKDARGLMEGQGYDEDFIKQALTTVAKSRQKTRDPQMRQFNQRNMSELMASLMASEFSLGTTADGDNSEIYYRSPLADKPRRNDQQDEMGVPSEAIFSRFLSKPRYKETIARVKAQQETRTRNRAAVQQALTSMYSHEFDFGNMATGTKPNAKAKGVVRGFLVEMAKKNGSPMDESEIDILKSDLNKLDTGDKFRDFIRKEIVNKKQGKDFGKYMEDYRAALFLRGQGIAPKERTNELTKKPEKVTVAETMAEYSKTITNLQQGNFETLVRKYGFDMGNVGKIASSSNLDVDELYFGEKIPKKNKMYARRLRETKVESFAQNAGYSGIDQMLEEMAQDQKGVVDPGRLNAAKESYRKVIEADWGNKKTIEAMEKFSRNLGMSDSDFMDTIISSNLLEEEKRTPKGLSRKISQFLSVRKNKLTAGLVAGIYQNADLRAAQSKINRELEQSARDRVLGLDAMITQTGGSLPDLLKTLDVKISASDFREQVRVDPSINKLKEILGGGEAGIKRLKQLSTALGTTTDKLLDAMEDAANLTYIEKVQVRFYTLLKEFGFKTSQVFERIGRNVTDFSLGFQKFVGLGRLDAYYGRLRKVYNKNLETYNKRNAYNLNFMIQEAGFETMTDFVAYLDRSGINKVAIGNLLKGKTGAMDDKSLKDVARILGLTRKNEKGEESPDIGMLKSPNFTTKTYKPFQSFFLFGLKATLKSKFIRRNLSRSMQTGVRNAVDSAGQLLTKVGQVNVRRSIEAIASSVERTVARFSMKIATGGREPATAMERLGKEVRRQIAVNLNRLALLATAPLKKMAAVAPNSKISEIVNAAYRNIPTRLLAIALATRESAEKFVDRGFKYQKKIARAEFFEDMAGKLENFQNEYPTVRTAIANMFTSMGSGFRHLGGVINAKALAVAKKIGFDDLYTKFKQAVKQVPGFNDVDRAARIATIQGFLKQVRKGANAAAQSAEQRRIQFAQPRVLGQAGYSVTDASGNKAGRIEERLNRPDSKLSPAAREYLEKRGYNIESLAPEQKKPEAIYGPFIKAFRTIAKAAHVSEGVIAKALSNPVIYALTRWTDLAWFLAKKVPSAIASGFKGAVTHVASRIIQVFPESAGIIIKSLDLVSRASRKVGNEIAQFLTSPASWVANAWARVTGFISSLWGKWVNRARRTGEQQVGSLNHGAADVTAAAWVRTENSTAENMQHMAHNAAVAGHQIGGAMTHAAQVTDQTLTHATRNPLAAFGKLQQAVMAIGGLGVGLSTLGNSLQESNPAIAGTLTKLSEVVFAVDAVGGAFYALQQFGGNLFSFFADESVISFLGAVKAKALLAIPALRSFGVALKTQFMSGALFANPIFLAIAGISAAVTALYFAFKNNFLGIRDLVGAIAPIFQKVAEIITGAINAISGAISALTSNMGVMLPQILLIGAVTLSSMESFPFKEILVSKMEAAEKAVAPIVARISRKVQGDTHYTALGVTPDASPQDVKAAYRSKAKQFHPDLNPSKGAANEFQKVTEAYRTLADAERRVAYDAVASKRAMGGFTNSVKRLPELLSSGVSGGMTLLKNFVKELPGIIDNIGRRSLELAKLMMGDIVNAISSNFPKLYKVIERIGQAILKKFNQLGTGVKKFIGFFLGPTDVAAFGMHRLGDAVSGLSPQVGKALHGLGDLTTWYGDFMGLHSMVYAGLKKFKLTKPLADLAKSIATSHPLLEKFARFSKGLADDGFEFLSKNYGDKFKAQLNKLTPALNSLKAKFSSFATSAISAFSTRWSSFVTTWPGMVDGAVSKVKPKFQGLSTFLGGVGSQMLMAGTSLTQPLLKASTAAAVQIGVLVPANQAVAASYAETAIAANSSSLAIVKSSGTNAIAVATEAGEIIPLNFSMAGSFGALTAGVTTATTAVWAFISPWVIAVSTALAPFLPVILGVVAAVGLFGFVWKTNLFGLGTAVKPLLDFSVGLLKIVGAAIYVVSGLFLVVNVAKLVWMILKNVFHGVSKTIQETQKTVVNSWFGDFFSKLIPPIKYVWNALITLSEAILGIGRGGEIFSEILEDIADRPMQFIKVAISGIGQLLDGLIKPLISVTLGTWDLAKAFGSGVAGAIASLVSVFQNTGNAIKGMWTTVVDFLQSTFQGVVNFLESMDWNVIMAGATDVLAGIGTAIAQPFIWIYNQIDAIAKKSTEVFNTLGEKLSHIPVIGIAFQKGLTQQKPAAQAQTQIQDQNQDGLVGASSTVGNAWDNATSRVADTLTSLPKIGEKVGSLLIGALNCSPTEQIPDAWESASERIQDTLNSVLKFALVVGGGIVAALATNKLMGLMSGSAMGGRASGLGAKFIKGSLYANALNDAAGLAGIDMPDWSQSLLSLTTFVGLAGDLVAEVIPAIATGAAGIGLSLSAVVGIATGGVAVVAGLALAWNKNLFDIQGKTKAFVSTVSGWLSKVPLLGMAFQKPKPEATPVPEATGVGSLSPTLDASPLVDASNTVNSAWDSSTGQVADAINTLPKTGEDAGNALIGALNCSPTVKIPQAWEEARTEIENQINQLPKTAQDSGNKIADGLSFFADLSAIGSTMTPVILEMVKLYTIAKAVRFVFSGDAFNLKNLGIAASGAKEGFWQLSKTIATANKSPDPFKHVYSGLLKSGSALKPIKDYLPVMSVLFPDLAGLTTSVIVFSDIAAVIPVVGLAISGILTPILVVVGALGAVLGVVELLTPGFNVLASVVGGFGFLLGTVKGTFAGFGKAMNDVFGPMPDLFGSLKAYVKDFKQTISQLFGLGEQQGQSIGYLLSFGLLSALKSGWAEISKWVSEQLSKLLDIPIIGKFFSKENPEAKPAAAKPAPAVSLPVSIPLAPVEPTNTTNVVAASLAGASNQIQTAWTGFGSWFGSFMTTLPVDAQMAGQGLISALNCWPTLVIPQAWERAAGQIGESLVGVTKEATTQGAAIAQGMQEQIAPSINTVAQKVALLKQGFNMRGTEMVLGEESIGDQLATLQGATVDFKRNLVNSLLHLNFEGARQSLIDYGEAWLATGGGVLGTLKSMTTSAIAFGVYSFLSLNPLILVLAGIALGALAIAFNFLGIRTIIGGLIEIIKGVVKLFVSTIQLAIQLGRAFRTIAQGIFTLDFDLIRRGAAQAFGAIGLYVQRLRESLTSILGGAISVVNGLFQGLGQIGNTVLGAIGFKSTFIGNAFNNVIGSVGYLGSALMTLVTKPQALWQKLKNLLDEIWDKLKSIREKAVSVKDKVSESLGNVGNSIKDSSLGQGVRAVEKRLKGESPTMADAKAAVDFEQRLKGKEPRITMGERVTLAKSSVNDFVGGMFGRKKKSEPIEVPVVPAPLPVPNNVKTPAAQATENTKATKESKRLARQQQRDLEQATKKAEQEQKKREDAFAASRNALGSMGSVLGTLVPQLAVPIMALDAVTNAFANMPDAIKESREAMSSLKAAFPGVVDVFNAFNNGAREMWLSMVSGYTSGGIIGAIQSLYQFLAVKLFAKAASAQATAVEAAIEVPANTAIALSEQAVAVAATQAGVAQVNSAITSSAAATTEAGVVGGANSFMSLTFGALATAAGAAWTAITGPLLPIIIAIGALVAVIGGIYLIFKTNFAGIGSLFGAFWNSLKQLGSSIMTLFSPLMPLIKLIGGVFIVALLSPVLLIVGALTLIVRGINAVIQGVIAIASTAFKFLWNLIPQPLRWLLEKAAQGIGFAINALFGGDKGAQQQTEELPQFAVGGPVSANTPGGPVAAILHDNEFVMNPDATRENYGLLQLLNSGVSAEDAIRMIPTTPPELVMPNGGMSMNAGASTITETPKIEINIAFTGNIVLGGNDSRENAREFMNLIGPEIEELVVEAMRQRGEFSR